MSMIRTEREAHKDLLACEAMTKQLAESHGLREYWAEAVYYGELSVEEAVKAQEEHDQAVESLNESAELDISFITSIEDFNKAISFLDKI